ncbi:hypothetical protein MRX96_021456 [Rhipicephalus microplus]
MGEWRGVQQRISAPGSGPSRSLTQLAGRYSTCGVRAQSTQCPPAHWSRTQNRARAPPCRKIERRSYPRLWHWSALPFAKAVRSFGSFRRRHALTLQLQLGMLVAWRGYEIDGLGEVEKPEGS